MTKVVSEGLTVQETETSPDRRMLTVRLDGTHVASISYHVQTDRTDTRKSVFWLQFVEISALNAQQITEIKAIAVVQIAKLVEKIFGGQQ